MAADLRANKIQTVIAPAPDPRHSGHGIRVVQEQNPAWYRAICKRYSTAAKRKRNPRLPDTKVKRKRILQALDLMAAGEPTGSTFYNDLIDVARGWQEEYL